MIIETTSPIQTRPPSPPPSSNACTTIVDPPPPYPSRDRRRATRPGRHSQRMSIQTLSPHTQLSSLDSSSDQESHSPHTILTPNPLLDDNESEDLPTFLASSQFSRRVTPRPRSFSHSSNISGSPSLGQTIVSLFRTTESEGGFQAELPGGRQIFLPFSSEEELAQHYSRRQETGSGFFSAASWKKYFRPMGQKRYYRSLFHLGVVNFPYALAAWIYIFVFTVAGTTLLMALPLGAILCFFNLIGARAFARGELALQTHYHSPLAYPAPYPPRPIFTRRREATSAEIEAGTAIVGDLVREQSFYRNTYSMFTDPTSYQALFYFLVIKPSITIVFSLLLIIFFIPAYVLILPAPAALRAVRRLGVWQANVAIEGLYLAVR